MSAKCGRRGPSIFKSRVGGLNPSERANKKTNSDNSLLKFSRKTVVRHHFERRCAYGRRSSAKMLFYPLKSSHRK